MATPGSYTDGFGDKVNFTVDLAVDPTGEAPFQATVYFSPMDKFLQCQIYGPDSAHPADPIGQQRFIEELGRAVALDAQTNPDAPMAARFAFSLGPSAAESFAAKMVTGDGPVKRNCLWADNSDPDSSLTIKVAVNNDILTARAELTDDTGAVVGQRDSFADGSANAEEFDTRDTHPYSKLRFSTDADNKVIAAQVTLDPDVLAAGMSIGQIFGSAIGGALGGNSLVGNLVGGAVGGLIGQKFVQVLAVSMTSDLSKISLNDVFAGQGISVANAGIGVISSFLTAELGHALHIDGFDGQLFNTAVSGFSTSLLTQVTSKMASTGLTFEAAIAAIDWTQALSGAIDVAQLNVGLGSYLGHELVPAQTREGAIGGQLFGAIGSFILPGGLGSLIGTIIGTLIGNQFGTSPSPGAVDLLDQAGYFYGHSEYQSSDGGGYGVSNTMAQAADDIINAYLHAVDGVALDRSKQVTLGYIKNPDLLYITGVPNHTDRSFTDANDAVHAVALDVLQHSEMIGGDLLLKRAHQNSPSNIKPVPALDAEGNPVPMVSVAEQLVTMSGDLAVAQDYENYLNNREAINALIAANASMAGSRNSFRSMLFA
jgi:outer membrane lipoprotein SlyB